MTKKIDYRDYSEFETEAYIIEILCDNCGATGMEEQEDICSVCDTRTTGTPETNIEGLECDACGTAFDMWDSCHDGVSGGTTVICLHCYDELRKESVGL